MKSDICETLIQILENNCNSKESECNGIVEGYPALISLRILGKLLNIFLR
jgi:hypothetical protein